MTLINQTWDFFASVKLAIVTLSALAVTSIIGTIIPQGESHAFYAKQYGAKMAQFFHILDIPNMYYSWWFLGLLGVLSANLIICSIDRLPRVWKIIRNDNLSISTDRLGKMTNHRSWDVPASLNLDTLKKLLPAKPITSTSGSQEDRTLFFSEKGKYSRLGVYLVHFSILVIFIGATIGHFYGFKGSVMIPELLSSGKAFGFGDQKPIEFGFDVVCNHFEIEFYNNGMPKEYTSSLTIVEDGKQVLTKSIEVNSPLSYKGFTFYQSSYQGYQDFIVSITDVKSDNSKKFTVPFQKQQSWTENKVQFGVINAEAIGQRVVRSKVWIKVPGAPAFTDWVKDNDEIDVSIGDQNLKVHVKQMYSTGLQVAKDPGVWIVYIGCGLLMLGLYMAFFMSHQRLWLAVVQTSNNNKILLSGSANKNKAAFKKNFENIEKQIETEISR